jgi:hypothetical protein
MRKFLMVAFIAAALAAPVAAQLRLDVGIDVPKGIGTTLSSDFDQSARDFLAKAFIPIPDVALHYQFDLGIIKLGAGVRAYTFIVASVLWPNVFAELDVGPLAVEGQIGGGLFAYSAISTGGIESGRVFFPDLSAWYAFGQKRVFRLGCGAIGVFLPNQDVNGLPFVFYIGGKAAIPL